MSEWIGFELIGKGPRRTKVDTKQSGMRAAALHAGHCNLRSVALRVCVAAGLVAALAGCMGYVPGRQTYWDAKVRELCAKDGGVEVYEKVRISRSDIERGVLPKTADGKLSVASKELAHPDAPVYSVAKITLLRKEGNPQVWRTEEAIVRRSDKTVVARLVVYTRAGGDFPTGISHGTSFFCPQLHTDQTDLTRLFTVEGEQK